MRGPALKEGGGGMSKCNKVTSWLGITRLKNADRDRHTRPVTQSLEAHLRRHTFIALSGSASGLFSHPYHRRPLVPQLIPVCGSIGEFM